LIEAAIESLIYFSLSSIFALSSAEGPQAVNMAAVNATAITVNTFFIFCLVLVFVSLLYQSSVKVTPASLKLLQVIDYQ
jgi:hypothetical protein